MPVAVICESRIKAHKEVAVVGSPIVPYLLAFLLVLSGNTLHGLLGSRDTIMYAAIVALMVLVIVFGWIKTPLRIGVLRRWAIWASLVLIAYLLVYFSTGDGYGKYGACVVLLLMICPLFLAVLNEHGYLHRYLKAYVNIMLVLAVISLVLWVTGPLLGVVSPNCVIENSWNGTGRKTISEGYYGLLYVTQKTTIANEVLMRNTGIFAEAPMYSYALCIALIFECFFLKSPRKWAVLILAVTVISTISTTGILFLMALSFVLLIRETQGAGSRIRVLLLMAVGIALVIVGNLTIQLLDSKMGTASGSIRLDDFVAGYQAWIQNPITGYGLGDSKSVVSFMSGFRLYNIGFSNSLFDLLVRGGLVFLTPFLIAFLGVFNLSDCFKTAGLLFLFLWVITIVTFQPITILFFSFGVLGLMYGVENGKAVGR